MVPFWVVASPLTIRRPRLVQRVGGLLVGWVKFPMGVVGPQGNIFEEGHLRVLLDQRRAPRIRPLCVTEGIGWRDYRLRVDGLVDQPREFRYLELLEMPKQVQITQHYCIQGWSGVAEWVAFRCD